MRRFFENIAKRLLGDRLPSKAFLRVAMAVMYVAVTAMLMVPALTLERQAAETTDGIELTTTAAQSVSEEGVVIPEEGANPSASESKEDEQSQQTEERAESKKDEATQPQEESQPAADEGEKAAQEEEQQAADKDKDEQAAQQEQGQEQNQEQGQEQEKAQTLEGPLVGKTADSDARVTVEPAGQLPADSSLLVEEILPDDERYADYVAATSKAAGFPKTS